MNAKNIIEQNELLELTDTELESVCGGGSLWDPYNYQYAYAGGYAYANSGNNTSGGNMSNGYGNGAPATNSNNGQNW